MTTGSSRLSLWAGGKRKSFWLVNPGLQLKLPTYVLLVTAAFVFLLGVQVYIAFGRSYAEIVAIQPMDLVGIVKAQTTDLLITSVATSIAYVLALYFLCVSYSKKLVGPQIAFRRHIAAIEAGDYTSRIALRKGDAFGDVAHDLNKLAETLEKQA